MKLNKSIHPSAPSTEVLGRRRKPQKPVEKIRVLAQDGVRRNHLIAESDSASANGTIRATKP
jgi:hypothetical protein